MKNTQLRCTRFIKLKYLQLFILLFVIVFIYNTYHRTNKVDLSNIAFEDVNIEQLVLRLGQFSEMTLIEKRFLYGLVQYFKPKKLVEIGVSKGGSAAIMLSAISGNRNAHLYSIDKSTHVYSKQDKPVGFLVNETFPELTNQWSLFTGVITAEVIERIGSNIDFVLIDTVHVTPGELLNILEVLPFLSPGAVVVFHDISLQLSTWGGTNNTRAKLVFSNNLLYYYLRGKKILPKPTSKRFFWNIGAIKLDRDQKQYYFDYFFPLAVHWEYMPSAQDLSILRTFFMKYYGSLMVRMFDDAIAENSIFLSHTKQNSQVERLNKKYEQ